MNNLFCHLETAVHVFHRQCIIVVCMRENIISGESLHLSD